MVLWDEVFYEVAKDFPDVKIDKELVDAVTTRMVLKPSTLDVIVATNLHADILSDSPLRCPAAWASRRPPTLTRAQIPIDVRADPRLCLRHHR